MYNFPDYQVRFEHNKVSILHSVKEIGTLEGVPKYRKLRITGTETVFKEQDFALVVRDLLQSKIVAFALEVTLRVSPYKGYNRINLIKVSYNTLNSTILFQPFEFQTGTSTADYSKCAAFNLKTKRFKGNANMIQICSILFNIKIFFDVYTRLSFDGRTAHTVDKFPSLPSIPENKEAPSYFNGRKQDKALKDMESTGEAIMFYKRLHLLRNQDLRTLQVVFVDDLGDNSGVYNPQWSCIFKATRLNSDHHINIDFYYPNTVTRELSDYVSHTKAMVHELAHYIDTTTFVNYQLTMGRESTHVFGFGLTGAAKEFVGNYTASIKHANIDIGNGVKSYFCQMQEILARVCESYYIKNRIQGVEFIPKEDMVMCGFLPHYSCLADSDLFLNQYISFVKSRS